MMLEDMYGDIFEENPIAENVIVDDEDLNWIFPIIGKRTSESNYFANGTGFFVNNDGYFVTAGHVLKESELAYFAIINDQELEFKILFLEYLNVDSQDGIICRDLAVCKLDFQSDYHNLLNEKDTNNSFLKITGYKREQQGRLTINPIKQGDYYLHTYQTKIGHSGIDIKLRFPKDNRYMCRNTNSLIIEDGLRYGGLSGGPVYLGLNICGMLISNEYILSSYILSKLDELGIKYNK